ncbi:MAG: RagB/SusD family nutrient uptake outer membrane protein [Balneolaceae bacterium]
MNYFKKLTYALSLLLVAGLIGCNDVLERVEPSTSVSGEVALNSPDGVNSIRASMYSKIRASFTMTTEYFVGPSALADETRNRGGSTRFQALATAVGTSGTAHIGSFGPSFNIIQDANLLIGAVPEGVVPPATLQRFRGEAYALRAFALHHSVRGLGYEPGNFEQGPEPNWDLGTVIRTEPVLDVADADLRPRSSVTDVYAQILDDLSEAKRLLSGTTDNTFVSEPFVDGLIARVNLYAGNWPQAAQAAQDAIDNFTGDLVDDRDGVAGMFFESEGNHPEALFKLIVNPNTEGIGGSNVNNGLAAYTSTQWVAQIPTQFVMDLYEEDDFRIGSFVIDDETGEIALDQFGRRVYEGGWYQPCFNDQQNTVAGNCNANDDALSTNKWNGDKGNMADDIPYMRVAEMYLIRAEALAKASGNPLDGVGPLNTLRNARGLDNIEVANPAALLSLEAFEDEILNERVRELVVEGHRFWDLKRLGRDIRNPDGSLKMSSDAFRILAPLGTNELNTNELLRQNPGYTGF